MEDHMRLMLSVILSSMAAFAAQTETLIFTGAATGSIGGTPFVNATLTITATAPVSSVQCGSGDCNLSGATVAFTISGIGAGTFTSGSGFNVNQTYLGGVVGFTNTSQLITLSDDDIGSAALASYNLQTSIGPLGPDNGNLSTSDWVNISTSLGAITLASFSNVYFQATVGPTVASVTSLTANGAYTAGATIPITVTFSGPVTVTGTPQLALNSGGTAFYNSGSGSTTLNFIYVVGANDSSAHLDASSTSALTLNGGAIQGAAGNNPSLTLPAPGSAGSLGANTDMFIGAKPPALFFTGEVPVGNAVFYLAFPDKSLFGYYTFLSTSIFYHFDMGYEFFVPGSATDVYFYDYASGHWWYTSASEFPYLYDFTLNAWLYYFPSTTIAGHYTTSPRYFVNLTTSQYFTM